MAFTGTPVVANLGVDTIRITGLSLAASAAGTITFTSRLGNPVTVDAIQSTVYSPYPSDSATLTLADLTIISVEKVSGANALNLTVAKTLAGNPSFGLVATFTNQDGSNATGGLEIYAQYIPSQIR